MRADARRERRRPRRHARPPRDRIAAHLIAARRRKAASATFLHISALTSLDTRSNEIGGEAAQQLAAAVLGSASLEVFGDGEVPIKQLRADALTELDLKLKRASCSRSRSAAR